jgi:hypothetical protein
LRDYSLLFARKFDPQFNQRIINLIDEMNNEDYDKQAKSQNSYWSIFYDSKHHIRDIKYKHRFLFSFFIRHSFEIFEGDDKSKLDDADKRFIEDELLKIVSSDEEDVVEFPFLKNIYSFFQFDEFAG